MVSFATAVLIGGAAKASAVPAFVEVALAAGIDYVHGFTTESEDLGNRTRRWIGGIGVAAGDYDQDGWVDLYTIQGESGPNLLFRNRGDGTFEEIGQEAGVDVVGEASTGPVFGDVDGDGWLDLVIGGIWGTAPRVFRNLGDGTFDDVTATAGLDTDRSVYSWALADHDRDGDLDLFCGRWGQAADHDCLGTCDGHVWINDGAGTFANGDAAAGILGFEVRDFSFTPNLADIDRDGWPDLLMASDFETSRVFLNQGDGTFEDVTDRNVITDENGMGASVGDYDNDGFLDWFVTAIFDHPPFETTLSGNRLYRGQGDGTFVEVSAAAGLRDGYWGWGSCFADFNNDGHLDIFHVNGWENTDPRFAPYVNDPSRLFMSNGGPGWTFTERAAEHGLIDTASARALVCFDYDRDGDVDIFSANWGARPTLHRNDLGVAAGGGSGGRYLNLKLSGSGGIPTAVGAEVHVTSAGVTQMRLVQAGSNFVSQQPLELHFGLAGAATIEEIRIVWADQTVETHAGMAGAPIATDQFLGIARGQEPCLLTRQVADEVVTGPASFVACNTLSVGPAVEVLGSEEVVFRAGRKVVLEEGFSVGDGGSVSIGIDAALAVP